LGKAERAQQKHLGKPISMSMSGGYKPGMSKREKVYSTDERSTEQRTAVNGKRIDY
jgi:hypothetical protein